MLVRGLGGQYLMLSGRAVYVDTSNGGGFIEIPGNLRFKGTVIALRLPYHNDNFSYLDYLEQEVLIHAFNISMYANIAIFASVP